jgi:hypothetical protein
LLEHCDIFAGVPKHRDVERRLEMREDKLTAVAAYNVLLPEVALLGRESAIVIGGQHLGIGAEIGGRPGESIRFRAGRRRGTQMAGERFFKGPVAVVKRHGVLLS